MADRPKKQADPFLIFIVLIAGIIGAFAPGCKDDVMKLAKPSQEEGSQK